MARSRSVALGVAWRSLHNFFRNPALFVPALAFPLFFFSAFAGGLSRIGDVPGFDFPSGYTAFQFAFVLLQSAAFGGVFTGFGMARDFETGFGRRMMLAAPDRRAIVAGYALSALARATVVGGMLFAVALGAGMRVDGGALDLGGLVLLALLLNVSAGFWAAGIALRFRSLQAGPLMQTPVFLVLFLAPVYVPLDLLETWIETVASVNPTTALIEGARSLISGSTEGVGLAFASAAGLIAVFGVWVRRGLGKAEAAGG